MMIREGGKFRLSDMLDRWEPGYEECDTPYEFGFAHGAELNGPEFPKPGCIMNRAEYEEYARGFWDGKQQR